MALREEIKKFVDDTYLVGGTSLCVFTPIDFKYHPYILFDNNFVIVKDIQGTKVPFVYKVWANLRGYGPSHGQYRWISKLEFEELKEQYPYEGEHLIGDFDGLKAYIK